MSTTYKSGLPGSTHAPMASKFSRAKKLVGTGANGNAPYEQPFIL